MKKENNAVPEQRHIHDIPNFKIAELLRACEKGHFVALPANQLKELILLGQEFYEKESPFLKYEEKINLHQRFEKAFFDL